MTKYIIAILFALVVSLFGTSYHYRSEVKKLEAATVVLEQNVQTWKDRTQEAIDREVLANTRCTISQQKVEVVTEANESLEESKNLTLRELAKQPHDQLLETIIDANQKPKTVADDARLSADIMRMLNSAYCAGAKDDSYCTPSGTPAKLPASKSK